MSYILQTNKVMNKQTSQKKTAWQLVSCGMLMHTEQCDKETFANKRITVDRMNFGVKTALDQPLSCCSDKSFLFLLKHSVLESYSTLVNTNHSAAAL